MGLILPAFVLLFVQAELVSVPLYARSHDRLSIAAFQSDWIGLVLAAVMLVTG